jgi:hypothetical protein
MISVDVPSETATIESLRETELQEARAIQRAMLSSEKLETPRVTIESEFQPVTEVGGDFLDYFLLSDGTAGLYLGDVTGKGLPAALFAAPAVGTLRGVHKTGTAPSAHTADAVGTAVKAGRITSSPGPTPTAARASCNADAPEPTATTCGGTDDAADAGAAASHSPNSR